MSQPDDVAALVARLRWAAGNARAWSISDVSESQQTPMLEAAIERLHQAGAIAAEAASALERLAAPITGEDVKAAILAVNGNTSRFAAIAAALNARRDRVCPTRLTDPGEPGGLG